LFQIGQKEKALEYWKSAKKPRRHQRIYW
jgi:hypothetical protein